MQDRPTHPSLFPAVDVTATPPAAPPAHADRFEPEQLRLLRDLVSAQDRQNELIEELVGLLGASNRQRSQELNQWKSANPDLAQKCRQAAESLSRVQTSFLESLTDEVNDHADALADGEFFLGEFVDRFGPRLAHLNGVLQVLAQLSGPAQQ